MSASATLTTRAATTALRPVQGILQRKCACGTHTPAGGECEECGKNKKTLQRKPNNRSEPAGVPSIVHEVLRSQGRPLDVRLRNVMEPLFGDDFGAVRVHTDSAAARSAEGVSAVAFTVGNHIVFGRGRFNPQSGESQKLLAHELAHTIQQRGMSPSFAAKLEIGEVGDIHEHQADAAAERASRRGTSSGLPATFEGLSQLPSVRLQRQEDPHAGLSIRQLRELALTDPEAAEALRIRFRAMANSELQRYARTDPAAQSVYEQRNVVPKAAEGQGQFSRQGIQGSLRQDIQQQRAQLERTTGITRRAPTAALPGGRTQGGTIGSARTDIPGLEDRVFIGRSRVAGGQVNPNSRFAPPTDPAVLPQTHGHAEQAIADQLEEALRSIPRGQLSGRRVWMLIEQEPCSTCAQGIADPAVEAGVLRRLSAAFPELTLEVRSLGSSALTVLQGGVRVNAAGGIASTTPGAHTPTSSPVRVGTQIRVVKSVQRPNGTTVAEIEYIFGENLEHLNHGAPSGGQVPSRLLLRITQNAEGLITAVESLSGEPQAFAEALVRQTLPRALAGELAAAETGTSEGAAAGARNLARLSQGLRIGGWATFVVITGYQLIRATPEQRPRVLTQAGGGLAGSLLTSYLVCNALLDLETAGWGVLICGLIVGGVGGYVGSGVAGDVYDAATRTALDQALQDLDRRPRNVRILFNILVGTLDRRQLPLDEHFVRRFMSVVPSNLRDYELVILAGQLGLRSGAGEARSVDTRTPASATPTHRSTQAPPVRRESTVCPNCHRTAAESRPPSLLKDPRALSGLDNEAIARWIQSLEVAAPLVRTRPHADASAPSHADETHSPTQAATSVRAQRDTVCPNCHRPVGGPRHVSRLPLHKQDIDALLAMPSRSSLQEKTLEALRVAIGQLPERQRPTAADQVYGPAPSPVHPQTAPQGVPTRAEQLGTVCPDCHRGGREAQRRSLSGHPLAFTDRDLQTIAGWIQPQQHRAIPPADRSQPPRLGVHAATTPHELPTIAEQQRTVCPSCHRGAASDQRGSLLEHSVGFGRGPNGQMTEADRQRLEKWLETVEH